MKYKVFFFLLLAYGCGSARQIPQSMPEGWDSTPKNWIQFENCVGTNPSDYICDSCYRAVVKRFRQP